MIHTVYEILAIIAMLAGAIGTAATFIVKNSKNAKLKAIAEKALQVSTKTNEITELVITKIADVETIYEKASSEIKKQGIKLGEVKKENVIEYIKEMCSKDNIEFNLNYWSGIIDELVALMNFNK